MNNLERYLDRVIEQPPANLGGTQPESDTYATTSLITGILRRWYIALLAFFVMCAAGIPAIWLSIKPLYSVTGAIRLAPILANILTGEADRGEISNYQSFMHTQAEMITSGHVVQRVADNLIDKNLSFFENEETSPVRKLKQAISNRVVNVAPARHTELIKVTMTSIDPKEAKQIVDAFISAYMAIEVSSSARDQDQKLSVLENEKKVLAEKLQSQHEAIRQLAQEYGTTTLSGRQDMMLQRVTALLSELTRIEARRINLEAQSQLLERTAQHAIAPEDLLKMHQEYINADPMVAALSTDVVRLDKELIVAGQTLTSTNPELKSKAELLKVLKSRLQQRKEEAGKTFDDLMSKEVARAGNEKLINARNELEQTRAYERRLQDVLAKEDAQTIEIGRKQLRIQDLQFQLELDKEMYDAVRRRIQNLEMERKRPARVSVAYYADIASVQDKRVKYSAALVFGALACGMMLAYLRDKADHSLRTPDDVAKRIGIRIIGTTTSSHTIKPALQLGQIAADFQTIRANLGLLDSGRMPRRLVVTSPGIREGKSTFSINLAISLAKSGKKVLLIDGDLRKPDIAHLLSLPRGLRGIQDVLFGKEFDRAVYSMPSTDLDVLAADSHNALDAYELLASPLTAQRINTISRNYDHVVIDTPPVLAFPDTLLWAKIVDAVILTTFAGQTTAPDLIEAKERLAQINARVLGTVLNNVRAGHSYYRYGYDYYAQHIRSKKNTMREKTKLLLPMGSGQDNAG